ncbi:hypothetical protein SLS57_001730 [Botryosphaeria dothidea]
MTPAVQATPSLALKALFSRSLESAQALATDLPGVDLYSEDAGGGKGLSDLLARPDIRGVIIAPKCPQFLTTQSSLPIPAQPAYIKAALAAGKHVLSEKPIAPDMASARALLEWYERSGAVDPKAVSWGVAENFRFMSPIQHAAAQVATLGRVLNFSAKIQLLMAEGSKYQQTSWRKTPSFQGGFLLDGGVHFVAATRLLLASASPPTHPTTLAAFTSQLQPHLPPVDTLDAIVRLSSGAAGHVSVSFGTTHPFAIEWRVSCERGSVAVGRGALIGAPEGGGRGHSVVVTRAGAAAKEGGVEEERVEFAEAARGGTGVPQEVGVWAEALVRGGGVGQLDARQSPREALRDLEILEAMLKSGENGGTPVTLTE